jgi:chromosomal replication initiation ATPase DnaA
MKVNYFALPGLVGLKELRVNSVKNIVLENLKIKWEDLTSSDRSEPLPDARKMFAYCIKKYCGEITSISLGRFMNRDHATILYYWKKCDHLRETDPEFRQKLQSLELKINDYNETI